MDLEKSDHSSGDKVEEPESQEQQQGGSAFKRLSWIDRLLALWILLAMAVGIILGNFVPETGPALQKGQFVGVSVPIGTPFESENDWLLPWLTREHPSCWVARHDVSHLV